MIYKNIYEIPMDQNEKVRYIVEFLSLKSNLLEVSRI